MDMWIRCDVVEAIVQRAVCVRPTIGLANRRGPDMLHDLLQRAEDQCKLEFEELLDAATEECAMRHEKASALQKVCDEQMVKIALLERQICTRGNNENSERICDIDKNENGGDSINTDKNSEWEGKLCEKMHPHLLQDLYANLQSFLAKAIQSEELVFRIEAENAANVLKIATKEVYNCELMTTRESERIAYLDLKVECNRLMKEIEDRDQINAGLFLKVAETNSEDSEIERLRAMYRETEQLNRALVDKNQRLERSRKALADTITDLEKERDEAVCRCEAAERATNGLLKQRTESAHSSSELHVEIERMSKENIEVNRCLREEREKLRLLTSDNAKIEHERNALIRKLQDVDHQFMLARQEHELETKRLVLDVQKFSAEAEKSLKRIAMIECNLHAETKRCTDLQRQLADEHESSNAIRERVHAASIRQRDIDGEVQSLTTRMTQAELQRDLNAQKLEKSQRELKEYQDQVRHLSGAAAKLEAMQEKLLQTEEELVVLQKEKTQVMDHIQSLRASVDAKRLKLTAVLSSNESLELRCSDLQDNLGYTKEQLRETSVRCDQATEGLKKVTVQLNETKQALELSQRSYDEKVEMLSQFEARVRDLEHEKVAYLSADEQSKAEKSHLEDTLGTLESNLKQLRSDLARKEEEISTLESHLSDAFDTAASGEDANAQLQERVETLESEIKLILSTLNECDAERKRLTIQHVEDAQELVQAKNEIRSLQGKLEAAEAIKRQLQLVDGGVSYSNEAAVQVKRVEELQRSLEELQETNDKLRTRLGGAKKKQKEAEKECKRYQALYARSQVKENVFSN